MVMSSVFFTTRCECGGAKSSDFCCSTHNTNEFCCKCGKTYRKTYDYRSDDHISEYSGGFGAYRLVKRNNVICGGLDSKRHALEVLNQVKNGEFGNVILSDSYVYFYDADNRKGKVVWGKSHPEELPEDFDEFADKFEDNMGAINIEDFDALLK